MAEQATNEVEETTDKKKGRGRPAGSTATKPKRQNYQVDLQQLQERVKTVLNLLTRSKGLAETSAKELVDIAIEMLGE